MPATATSWKRVPFTHGIPIPVRMTFDAQQFARLKEGLIPRAMEDKWFIYYEEPHLFLHRSWTGLPIYRLAFRSEAGGAEVTEALRAEGVGGKHQLNPDYEVELLDFVVAKLLLRQAKRSECLREGNFRNED